MWLVGPHTTSTLPLVSLGPLITHQISQGCLGMGRGLSLALHWLLIGQDSLPAVESNPSPCWPWAPYQAPCVGSQSLQSCLTLCDPMDCSLPGSSVHGIFQARIPRALCLSSFPLPHGSFWLWGLPLKKCGGGWLFLRENAWKHSSRLLPTVLSSVRVFWCQGPETPSRLLSFWTSPDMNHCSAASVGLCGLHSEGPWVAGKALSTILKANNLVACRCKGSICHGQNCPPLPQLYLEVLTPSTSIMTGLERGSSKRGLNEVTRMGPNPVWLVSLEEEIRTQTPQRKDHVTTRRRQPAICKERSLTEPTLPTPWSWTPGLQKCEELDFCGALSQRPQLSVAR